MNFLERVRSLPTLGIGVSTEYGAGDTPCGLDIPALATHQPEWASFLELGVEVSKGIDTHGEAWLHTGRPTTHHFLDVNLDDPADFDPAWMESLRALLARSRPAWLCGDAGLWHFGRRERGHMLLLPPLLTDDAARAYGAGIVRLREATGLEVLPENPPGAVYVGNQHLLDTFARMCEAGDTGMLLDAAHLAIYQRLHGHDALIGLDGFPLDRIVEIHVAGARIDQVDGYTFVEDDHTPAVLPETWEILSWVAARAPNLRAVVVECERNPLDDVREMFAEVERRVAGSAFDLRRRAGGGAVGREPDRVTTYVTRKGSPPSAVGSERQASALCASPPRLAVQRAVVRLLHVGRDGAAAPDAVTGALLDRFAAEGAVSTEEMGWLQAVDPRAWRTDPWRTARLLGALLEEFPGAAAAYGHDMLPFFRSTRFDACLRDGGSLAGAFGAWFVEVGDADVVAHARVEGAIAELRRVVPITTPTTAAPSGLRVRAPLVRVLTGYLAVPADDASAPSRSRSVDLRAATLLVQALAPDADGSRRIVVSEFPEALARLLIDSAEPRPRGSLLADLRALGADPGEDEEVLGELERDGLIVPP